MFWTPWSIMSIYTIWKRPLFNRYMWYCQCCVSLTQRWNKVNKHCIPISESLMQLQNSTLLVKWITMQLQNSTLLVNWSNTQHLVLQTNIKLYRKRSLHYCSYLPSHNFSKMYIRPSHLVIRTKWKRPRCQDRVWAQTAVSTYGQIPSEIFYDLCKIT